MRVTKKDHTVPWLSRLRLNPGKQMGLVAEGQAEQARPSLWPASTSEEKTGGCNKAFQIKGGRAAVVPSHARAFTCINVWCQTHLMRGTTEGAQCWALGAGSPGEAQSGMCTAHHVPGGNSAPEEAHNNLENLPVGSRGEGTNLENWVGSTGVDQEAKHAVVQGDAPDADLTSPPSPGEMSQACSSCHSKAAVKWQEFSWRFVHWPG